MATKNIKVADYIKQQIALSDRSQKDIAEIAGFSQANNVSMIKEGISKLSINRVPGMAKALGVDPAHLLRITLMEYMPETWAVIDSLMGKAIVTENEQTVLKVIRSASRNIDIDFDNPAIQDKLRVCIGEIAAEELRQREGSVQAAEKLKKNKVAAK